jgi:hypothetical protein
MWGLSPTSVQVRTFHNDKVITERFIYSSFPHKLSFTTNITKMAGRIQDPQFHHITIKEIGPTFAAEVEGVDFSQDIPQDVFDEILGAITKVSDPCQSTVVFAPVC